MVIGAFFSEAGTELLGRVATADTALPEVRDDLVARGNWTASDYRRARAAFASYSPVMDLTACDLGALKGMLLRKKSCVLGLLSNASLLEHEQFTDMLWAVTHLAEGIDYVDHLQRFYPYLFSLTVRSNPLDPSARVTVTE